jgi:uncharacterized protein (TIGR02996 family)
VAAPVSNSVYFPMSVERLPEAKGHAMTERERLLRAIESEPDDDAPRLIYADWLEENGDEDRSRFIRLQCEYSRRFPNRGWPLAPHPEADALATEIEGLLARHRDAWTAGLPKWARGERFERGFPHVWRMTGKQFLDDAAAIRAVTPLGSLSLRLLNGREPAVFASPHLAGVSKLMANGAQLTDAGVEAIVASAHLGRVRCLWLGRDSMDDSRDANKLTDAAAVALASAGNLPSLIYLELAGHRKITFAGIKALTESPHRAGLTRLNVSGGPGGADVGELFRAPGFRLKTLEELILDWRKLEDAGAAALAGSRGLSRLSGLHLSANGIKDRGAEALAASPHLGGLYWLSLWSNNVGDAGAAAIAASPHLKSLRRLHLGNNRRVTDAGARALLAAGRVWDSLGLEGTGVSPAIIEEAKARCRPPS